MDRIPSVSETIRNPEFKRKAKKKITKASFPPHYSTNYFFFSPSPPATSSSTTVAAISQGQCLQQNKRQQLLRQRAVRHDIRQEKRKNGKRYGVVSEDAAAIRTEAPWLQTLTFTERGFCSRSLSPFIV